MKLVGYEALFLPCHPLRFYKGQAGFHHYHAGVCQHRYLLCHGKNMGHEGLSSGVVLLTTLFSAFTLTPGCLSAKVWD